MVFQSDKSNIKFLQIVHPFENRSKYMNQILLIFLIKRYIDRYKKSIKF